MYHNCPVYMTMCQKVSTHWDQRVSTTTMNVLVHEDQHQIEEISWTTLNVVASLASDFQNQKNSIVKYERNQAAGGIAAGKKQFIRGFAGGKTAAICATVRKLQRRHLQDTNGSVSIYCKKPEIARREELESGGLSFTPRQRFRRAEKKWLVCYSIVF